MTDRQTQVRVHNSLAQLIPVFFDNRRALLDEACDCCESGDLERLRGIGHNFKGACGSYGFQYLSSLGEELQHAQGMEQARELVRRMREHLEQVEVVFV
jgi:HPt (histidine-containing phosphotransfer) domain-containing protein